MTINVVMIGSTIHVLVDERIPDGVLQGPPRKLGMFEQADVDWGLKNPPPPQPLGDVNRQPVGVVQSSSPKVS